MPFMILESEESVCNHAYSQSRIDSEDVYIRLTPVFHGPFNERRIWRLDRGMGRRSVAMKAYGEYFREIYDSLVAIGDTIGKSPVATLMNQPSNSLAIVIWPNPTEGKLFIEYRNPVNVASTQIIVTGASDGIVYFKQDAGHLRGAGIYELDLAALPSGQYFVVVTSECGILSHKLISIIK